MKRIPVLTMIAIGVLSAFLLWLGWLALVEILKSPKDAIPAGIAAVVLWAIYEVCRQR